MTAKTRKPILLAVVLTANVVLWAIPSNVVQLIARDRHVILGRYSREHFVWILVLLVASLIALYIGLGPAARQKRRAFQVTALFVIGLPLLFVLDLVLTIPPAISNPVYIFDGLAYHRPPGSQQVITFTDSPAAHRTFPNAPADAGYGTVTCTFTVDSRGYRNRIDHQQCDILVLGDSFAEGSRVSDDQTWEARVAERTGLRICSLGMSGYDPQHYLAALRKHGPELRPRLVIVMIYEGNDFRSAEWVENPEDYKLPFGKIVQYYIHSSRVLTAIDGFMCQTLGAINAHGPVPHEQIISWLPLRIDGNDGPTYYAFSTKRMTRHYVAPDEFRDDDDYKTTVRILNEIRAECRSLGAELLIMYAPDKPHVVLPLVADSLPAEQVHAFASLRLDDLPDPDAFLKELLERLPSKEAVMREYCQTEGIAFLSTTQTLRESAGLGHRVYYTYDQHWTPLGHEAVARLAHEYLQTPVAKALLDRSVDAAAEPTVRPASAPIPADE